MSTTAAAADAAGEPRVWGLGETLEKAVALLEKKYLGQTQK